MSENINIKNKKASFLYEWIELMVAGMILTGSEIKSIRAGNVSYTTDTFCFFQPDGLYIKNLHIAEYPMATINNHEPKRDRKLLVTKRELEKLRRAIEEKGLTIVPTRLFINERGLAKLEIALARGKKLYDKKNSLRERDLERDSRQEVDNY